MPPSCCGVQVDHLRLKPQPELHPEPGHIVHQRMQPLRPNLARNSPIPQAGAITSPSAEPAIIEHVTLNTDAGRALGQLDKTVEIMIEIHRLPDIESHRAARGRMSLPGSQEAVETTCDLIQAASIAAVDPRRGISLARLQDHLTR